MPRRGGVLAEGGRDGLYRLLFEMAEREGRALERRQFGHRLLDPRPHLAAVRQPFRARGGRGQALHQRRGVLVLMAHGVPRTLPQQVDRAVRGDAVQPRPQARAGLEARQLRVGLQEGLLHHVLGVLLVAGQAVGDAEDSSTVPLDERAECVAVPGPRLGQDKLLGAIHLRVGRHFRDLVSPSRVPGPGLRGPGPGSGS